jgi:hypothetical protein
MANCHRSLELVRKELFSLDLYRLWFWTDVKWDYNPVSHTAHGWYHPVTNPEKASGVIAIPPLSVPLTRWWSHLMGMTPPATVNFTDVLRHEFGHALADGLNVMCNLPSYWGSGEFLSDYAETNADEDFAETFMYYLKHKGRIPRRNPTQSLNRKWKYIEKCIARMSKRRNLPLSCECTCGTEVVLAHGPGVYRCPESKCDFSFEVDSSGFISVAREIDD